MKKLLIAFSSVAIMFAFSNCAHTHGGAACCGKDGSCCKAACCGKGGACCKPK